MRDVVIDGVTLSEVTPVDSAATTQQCSQSGVQRCGQDTCEHGGVCSTDWDTYWCECKEDYMGLHCEHSEYESHQLNSMATAKCVIDPC